MCVILFLTNYTWEQNYTLKSLQVVEKVRQGTGEKKILVIDIETEDEMKTAGEAINPDDAIVMIPRPPPPPPPAPVRIIIIIYILQKKLFK